MEKFSFDNLYGKRYEYDLNSGKYVLIESDSSVEIDAETSEDDKSRVVEND